MNDGLTRAVGEIAHFTGRLFAENGSPVRNAFIEIWQSDVNGSYIHTEGRNDGKIDANFQGYGRFLTDAEGRYYFRTIKPVPYTLQGQFRAPHIHVAVSKAGQRIMATQALVKGHEANERDLITQRIKDPKRARDADGRVPAAAGLDARRADGQLRHPARASRRKSSATAASAASAKPALEVRPSPQLRARAPYNPRA